MLFFERYSLVLDALLIAPNLGLKSTDLLLGFSGISFSSFGWNFCFIYFNFSSAFTTVRWLLIQEIGIGSIKYIVSEIR